MMETREELANRIAQEVARYQWDSGEADKEALEIAHAILASVTPPPTLASEPCREFEAWWASVVRALVKLGKQYDAEGDFEIVLKSACRDAFVAGQAHAALAGGESKEKP